LGLLYENKERNFIKEAGETRVNTMTQSLKTLPKTSQRPLFLRKRGYLNLQKGGKTPKIPGAVAYRGNLFQKKFTGKEPDQETGLYYYGARYLDPKTSRWLSGDPALGDYLPVAPLDDEAKKHNQNLPGMGGVFNVVNMHAYHYAGNNPVKYTDPDGKEVDAVFLISCNTAAGFRPESFAQELADELGPGVKVIASRNPLIISEGKVYHVFEYNNETHAFPIQIYDTELQTFTGRAK
jgi:RHS repeat-associated protein